MNVYDLLTAWGDSKELLRKGGILSTQGRVLVMIMADPEVTQVAVSVVLGISPSAVEKAVLFWVETGILSSERNGRNNKYLVDFDTLRSHPDYKVLALLINNDKI
jgi:hypothetical protein